MKILFGDIVKYNASPVACAEWIEARVKGGLSSFPRDSKYVEGDLTFPIPTEVDGGTLASIYTGMKDLQKVYLMNQLRDHIAGRFMTVTYRMFDAATKEYPARIRIVERAVAPGLDYNKMKYANPKGKGFQSKKWGWDEEFTLPVKSTGEQRKVFINVYDDDEIHTPEHLTSQVYLRLPVTYDKDGNPTKSKTTYLHEDYSPMTPEELESTSHEHTGYISTVFQIGIEKILKLE